MGNARRAKSVVFLNGRDISEFVIDFNYTDNTDTTDDASIKLSDREERWANEWFPETGDMIDCSVKALDWNRDGDDRVIIFGVFEVDSIEFADVVTVKAVAAPITSSVRSEKKYRNWAWISLSGIAGDIAGNAGLELVYETDIDPYYDETDQNDKSDLQFLEELCKSDGLCLKVTDNQLVIFEESKYDEMPAVVTIVRGSTNIIGIPRFKRNAKNIYTACEINYYDPFFDDLYTGYFEAPNVGNVGHTLRLRENYNSESDDMDLNRKAKARLGEQNKNEWTCDITLVGDTCYFAGNNVEIVGWYKFDGKYHISSCTHNVGPGGYTVKLSLRRCLEGY